MESNKDYTLTLIFSWLLGWLGIHRFYTGYIGIGIIQLLTAGGFGIWWIIDFISVCFDKYKTSDGLDLANPSETLGKVVFFVWLILLIGGTSASSRLVEIFSSASFH